MKFNFLSHLIPHWIRSSIAFKVLFYVGTAIICLVALQTYINVNQMNKKLNPLVFKKLKHTVASSENIFNIIVKQTQEDAKIIGAHNALTNYIDYEILNDVEGMNEEVVNLEQFLRSLTNFKAQYENIEIINNNGSIIRFKNGEIAEKSNLHQLLFPLNTSKNSHATQYNSLIEHPYFTNKNDQILFTLTDHIQGDNPFTNGQGSNVFINITNNISNEVYALVHALKADHILLSLQSKNQYILHPQENELRPEFWLTESLSNTYINLNLTVYKEKKEAFLIIKDMENASFILAMGSIIVISISLFLTAKFVIDSPLKNIIKFINKDVLKQNNLNNRYQTTNVDEIGIFSHGLNNMLDEIQFRENALKNSEERLALALWGGDEGMWELDFISSNIYLDIGSSKILSLGEVSIKMPAEKFYLMIYKDDVKATREYIEGFTVSNNEVFEVEFRFITYEKHYLWLKLKGKLNEKDNKSLGITGTLRDITEEIRAEQETQLYATAFNSSNNGIAILDINYYILAVNKAFSRITGFISEEAAGRLATFIGHHENGIKLEDIKVQIDKHGHWSGEIIGERKNKEVYVRDVALNPVYGKGKELTHYVCVFSDITEQKKFEKELWEMANYDILTKLPNRGYFRKAISNAVDNSTKNSGLIALLFLDLDKFKQVNDTLGHEAGDELLIKVAAILSKTIRKNDSVSRLGGDEFAILLEGINEKENAEIIAKKIIAEFVKGININDTETGIGVSIGISFYPNDADDTQSLVHCADTAMYSAKTTGSNLYHFYHTSMRDHVNRRNQIEQELNIALKEGGLSLHYQPQLDINTGKIVSFEALSRWFHPELGFISPEEFIPIAEETGLIAELGLNVFNQACNQLKEWHLQGYPSLRMAINISPKQFMLTDIHIDISNSIKECGIDAKYLELELTESLIIEDPDKIIGMLHILKKMGIRLSIDDFGTGYSSLSYLSRFPLDTLKIDKSFVQKTESDSRVLALTKAIVGIARSLDLEVIAEGVETKEQLNILKDLGCQYMQGYYYSAAVSADKAMLLLKEEKYL
jgi:diguanylate cyclase (GGDEF)-like protein/PAS domain S-box-containing protein